VRASTTDVLPLDVVGSFVSGNLLALVAVAMVFPRRLDMVAAEALEAKAGVKIAGLKDGIR
jgi:hypothetical protein